MRTEMVAHKAEAFADVKSNRRSPRINSPNANGPPELVPDSRNTKRKPCARTVAIAVTPARSRASGLMSLPPNPKSFTNALTTVSLGSLARQPHQMSKRCDHREKFRMINDGLTQKSSIIAHEREPNHFAAWPALGRSQSPRHQGCATAAAASLVPPRLLCPYLVEDEPHALIVHRIEPQHAIE